MIGERIGRYHILDRLGSGGMGIVYRALDTTLDREVALKFLPQDEDEADASSRFLREARAVSKLDHPNICTVHEIDQTDTGGLYIVMGCYEGETLKAVLGRGPLPAEEAFEILRQIALGLEHAHGEEVVHRDLKPANIFLTTEGRVKILDFGLAKVAGEAALTRSGSSIGTPFYMSPEQVLGKADARSDLWALGLLLYEMLTGHRPFEAENDLAVIHAILHRPVVPLADHRDDLPPLAQHLIDRLLAKEPDDRVQSAADLLDVLPAPAEKSDLDYESPDLASRIEDLLPRRRRFWRWAAAALLLLGVAAAWAFFREPAPAPPPVAPPPAAGGVVAVLPFAYRGSPELAYLGEGMVHLMGNEIGEGGKLRAVDPRLVLEKLAESGKAPRNLAGATALAGELGADLVLLGDIVEIGGKLRIDAKLYRQGVPVSTAVCEGPAPEVFDQVEWLAGRLIAGLDGQQGHSPNEKP